MYNFLNDVFVASCVLLLLPLGCGLGLTRWIALRRVYSPLHLSVCSVLCGAGWSSRTSSMPVTATSSSPSATNLCSTPTRTKRPPVVCLFFVCVCVCGDRLPRLGSTRLGWALRRGVFVGGWVSVPLFFVPFPSSLCCYFAWYESRVCVCVWWVRVGGCRWVGGRVQFLYVYAAAAAASLMIGARAPGNLSRPRPRPL